MRPKTILYVAVVLLLLSGGVLLWLGVQPFTPAIHGYSGLEATMYSVDHPGYSESNTEFTHEVIQETLTPTSAEFDYDNLMSLELYDPTGLYCSISQPQKVSEEVVHEKASWAHVGADNVTTTYEGTLVKMQMYAFIRTAGTGYEIVSDVTFNVRLRQNPYTVFQDADSSYACIVNVRLNHAPEKPEGDVMQVDPSFGGADFGLTTVTNTPAPNWTAESGYSGAMTEFADVTFPIRVVRAQPTSVAGIGREESQTALYIDVDVLLLGKWVVVRPWVEPDFPADFDWLMLIAKVGSVAVALFGTFKAVRLRGVWRIIALVAVWLPALYLFGVFDMIAGWVINATR